MTPADGLTVTAPTDTTVVMTRAVAAPPDRVFAAFTQPDLLKRWLTGPPGWAMTACACDPRPGGRYRHDWAGPGGVTMAMSGEYREVTPPGRLVRTERFEFGCDAQAGEQVATAEFAAAGGLTVVTLTVTYPSKEARDATLASGMKEGVAAGYARLDALLAA